MLKEPPIVIGIENKDGDMVITCPYCGKRHIHGKGEGHRVAHCLVRSRDNNGYTIVLEKKD